MVNFNCGVYTVVYRSETSPLNSFMCSLALSLLTMLSHQVVEVCDVMNGKGEGGW